MILTKYTERATNSSATYELLADGKVIGLIQWIGEDNWQYTLDILGEVQSGFKTFMYAYHKATWTHKHAMRYGVVAT